MNNVLKCIILPIMKPKYDLEKIKFATDGPTFEKAVALYEDEKVTEFEDTGFTFIATVLGTQPYKVFVSNKKYDVGGCDCYLGKNDTLCKHMVAVAIYAVMDGKPLNKAEKQLVGTLVCSGRLGELNTGELKNVNAAITNAIRYIKPYDGPSRIWFAYQNSLSEGCNRMSAILSDLPVSEQTADLLVDLLLRLDKKLTVGGVDDSDGTVGGFIEDVVNMLEEYAKLDSSCIKSFSVLKNIETCFGWEKPLLNKL